MVWNLDTRAVNLNPSSYDRAVESQSFSCQIVPKLWEFAIKNVEHQSSGVPLEVPGEFPILLRLLAILLLYHTCDEHVTHVPTYWKGHWIPFPLIAVLRSRYPSLQQNVANTAPI